jgi:hypothetical protein
VRENATATFKANRFDGFAQRKIPAGVAKAVKFPQNVESGSNTKAGLEGAPKPLSSGAGRPTHLTSKRE